MLPKCRLLAIASLIFAVSSCTHYYIPDETTFDTRPNQLPEMTEARLVSLQNTQEPGREILFFVDGPHKWMAELQQWTESAARLLRQELEKKNFNVVDEAPKTLKLRVSSPSAVHSFLTIRAMVTLTVETGDGEVRSFHGQNKSPWSLGRAVDGALMFAVSDALSSDQIIDYLAGSKDTAKANADAGHAAVYQ